MSGAKIPWLAEAADRLRLYHVEIDAAMRNLAWGEEFTNEHTIAFMEAVSAADKIKAAAIRYLSEQVQRRAHPNSSNHVQRRLESAQHLASRNGEAHNDAGPVILKY